MGLDDLVLVKPKEFPSQTAIWRAAGAEAGAARIARPLPQTRE